MPGSTGRWRRTTCSWPTRTGTEVLAATYAHDEKGLTALCRMLVRMEVALVAVERPDGLLVERLLDAGLRVLALHPNKVAAARDRFRVAGGKSDRFDAFVLCELARTDHHRFRVLEPDSDETKAIRALTRAREDLVETRTGIMNQLRAELERFWPGPLRLFSHMDAEILLAFLERYPSPRGRPWSRGRADAGVSRARAVLGRTASDGADGQAAQRPTRAGRRARARRPPAARARLRRDDPDAERADQAARGRDQNPGSRAPRRADLPLAVQIAGERDHRRGAARRDRRLPRALPHPRRARRRRRPGCGRRGVRQVEDRRLPPRVQQAPARRVLPPGGQQPPLAPLGPGPLRPSPPARPRTPPRDPHRRPRLVPGRVAMLAQPHPIRPRATPRTATPHHSHHPQPVGPTCPTSPPPSGWPAPLSPNGRPAQAERAALDSKPPSATHTGG